MIKLKTPQQIQGIEESGHILAELFEAIESLIIPGISTYEIDRFVIDFLEKRKAEPAFLGYHGFPGALCCSINDEVIHGIPSKKRVLKEGDIIGCDIGVTLNGYISDSAKTFTVGEVAENVRQLLDDTKKALELAVQAAVLGNRVKDIGKAVSEYIKPKGYGIVYSYCGHGVGLEVHEDPQVSNNYPSRGPNPRLRQGMVLALEPMINMGTGDVELMDDDWTVKTCDGKLSAHFEHTIVIEESGTRILTQL